MGLRWTPSSAEGRWCGFGPYYAMFPVEFARRVVDKYCPPRGRVIDPFCGRGTTPFVAAVSGRKALAVDINPVAWIFASTKIAPCSRPKLISQRVSDVFDSVRKSDRIPQNEFQKWAWHSEVLGFLNASRRILDWRKSVVDRTLMATILVHLHAKRGGGLSNQLRQSKSMAPDYSVRWWKRNRSLPPRLDIVDFFEQRLAWRYKKGLPNIEGDVEMHCGDALRVLERKHEFGADLVLTSPPYAGVTNYEYDNWIRLWMLGGPPLPNHRTAQRYADPVAYEDLLSDVFGEVRRLSKRHASIYVRTDARRFTFETTMDVLTELWPHHRVSIRYDKAKGKTQTGLFHRKWKKAGELDIVLTP